LININLKDLKERVPEIIFKQGVEYYKKGQVKITNWDNSSVIASVQDGHPYVVRLSANDRFFETVCTCSFNHVCKHAVAAALAIIEDHGRDEEFLDSTNWREYFLI